MADVRNLVSARLVEPLRRKGDPQSGQRLATRCDRVRIPGTKGVMDDQDHQCLRFVKCRASVRDGYLDALLTLGDVALEELALCSPPEQAHDQFVRVSP